MTGPNWYKALHFSFENGKRLGVAIAPTAVELTEARFTPTQTADWLGEFMRRDYVAFIRSFCALIGATPEETETAIAAFNEGVAAGREGGQ